MIANNSKSEELDPAERIQEIYKLIQQGEAFEDLAAQFSDDQSSAKKGGRLNSFKSGQLRSVKFEDKAFSMTEIGEISEPFKTDYGWHIAKLYNKTPIEPFDKIKGKLESRVKSDSRSEKITESFINSLIAQYKVPTDIDLSYFVSIITDDYFGGTWTAPEDVPDSKELLSIGDEKITYLDFAQFLQRSQKRVREKQSYDGVVNGQYNAYLKTKLLQYHEDNLENVNEEYAQVLKEYRDGLLLFDLMEKKVWNAVKEDSIGIQNYYENHMQNYQWPERIDAIVATSADEDVLKKAIPKIMAGESIDSIKEELNAEGEQNIIFTTGMMQAGHRSLPKGFVFKKGMSEIYQFNNAKHVVFVKDIVAPSTKTLDEAKGKVISDYQVEFEQRWLDGLAEKYEVKIDKEVLQMIKSQISN